ncbi:hypothetical protein [Streptomyces sp. NPDC059893]|uniref:hypothetical protein n=1 Tax=Streptomyces sp. NPDC059893 TaxID=3346990 RepID=UPI003669957D
MEQFNGMTPLEFEQAVANLTQRDGSIVDQRHGAHVIWVPMSSRRHLTGAGSSFSGI